MPVVVDGFDLVALNTTLHGRFPGGIGAFARIKPETFCTDGIVSRLGFFHPTEARLALQHLQTSGLQLIHGDSAIDAVIVNSTFGFSSRCEWVSLGQYRGIPIAWNPRVRPDRVAVPEGWTPQCRLQYMSEEDAKARLSFQRREGEFDVYLDSLNHQLVRLRRADTLALGFSQRATQASQSEFSH